MTIHSAHIMVHTDSSEYRHRSAEVIKYEGKFWLVPEWMDNINLGICKPVRIISLETMQHSESRGFFVVEFPIPETVLLGVETEGFVVQERPPITFPIPPRPH
jgi:hypothetical protein